MLAPGGDRDADLVEDLGEGILGRVREDPGRGEPGGPDQGTDDHEDENPFGERDAAEGAPQPLHRAASIPALASIPVSTAAWDAANISADPILSLFSPTSPGATVDLELVMTLKNLKHGGS